MLRGTHWPQGRVGLWASPRMSKIPGLARCVQDGKSIVWGRWSCGVPSLCCGAGRWKYHIPADAPSTAIPGCAAPARPGSYLQQQYSCWHLTFCFRSFASVPVQLSAPCQEPSKEHSAPCLLPSAAACWSTLPARPPLRLALQKVLPGVMAWWLPSTRPVVQFPCL